MLKQKLKSPVYRVSALYWRVRTRGRIQGRSFLISRPRRLALGGPGLLLIGDGTRIDTGSSIVVTARCSIGRDAYLGRDLVLVAWADVTLGDRILLGERVSIHTENHGPAGDRYDYRTAPIEIGDDVWIGAGVVVTAGVAIGAAATVGANAVVTRDIAPGSLAVGVPAAEKVGPGA